MSNSRSSSDRSGVITFLGLLAALFVGLKLGHVIDWPWCWVLCPLWSPVAALACVLLFGLAAAATVALVKTMRS